MPAEHEFRQEEHVPGDASSRIEVRAYSRAARAGTVALRALATLNLVYVAAHLLLEIIEGTQRAPPLAVALGLAVFSGIPWAMTMLLHRLRAGVLEVRPSLLVLTMGRKRFEIPIASLSAARPWLVPLPGPGLALVMTSGRRFRLGLQLDQLHALLTAIGNVLPAARTALDSSSVAHARAKYERGRRRWYFWLFKFGLVPLAITIVLFRLHQYIVYGGPFGQYHWFGLAAYLKSFSVHWAGILGGLVVHAGMVRLVVEFLALPATWALPLRAGIIRRAAEICCELAYFGLVPSYVLFRLLL
jgi:hypothetical protein